MLFAYHNEYTFTPLLLGEIKIKESVFESDEIDYDMSIISLTMILEMKLNDTTDISNPEIFGDTFGEEP